MDAIIRREYMPLHVALVGCSSLKRKTDKPIPAHLLYQGRLTSMGFGYAKLMGWDVFFISARHGLLSPWEPIYYYDMPLTRLTKPRRGRWAHDVVDKLDELYPGDDLNLIILAGSIYADPIIGAIAERESFWTWETPLAGMDLFARLRFYKKELEDDVPF